MPELNWWKVTLHLGVYLQLFCKHATCHSLVVVHNFFDLVKSSQNSMIVSVLTNPRKHFTIYNSSSSAYGYCLFCNRFKCKWVWYGKFTRKSAQEFLKDIFRHTELTRDTNFHMLCPFRDFRHRSKCEWIGARDGLVYY